MNVRFKPLAAVVRCRRGGAFGLFPCALGFMTAPVVALALEGVCVRYGTVAALEDVSGIFHAGSLTAVAGPNGAGKSTLLKAIAGLIKPSRGRVVIAPEMRGKTGYLPQTSALARTYPFSVLQTVCTGFWNEVGERGALTKAHIARADEALARVGLEGLANRQIGELSGGQFQKTLFARLWVQDPSIVLLDEPFAALDAETISKLMHILMEWHRQGKTVVCVLHDLLLIRKYFPESFVLSGRCLCRGHTHALFEQKLLSFDLDMAELLVPEETEKS